MLFISLDTSGIWNMNRTATKTSTRDTYSASLGLESFILAKNLSQDPIFMVTSFLSILSTSSEFSTGHAFHLFNLIFSMVTSFVLLSEEKISKNKKKKSKNPKKTTIAKNGEKRGAKVDQYLEEHIEGAIWAVFVCAEDRLVINHISTIQIT